MLNPPEVILTVAMSVETRGLQKILERSEPLAHNGLVGIGGLVADVPTWIVETGIGPGPAARTAAKVMELGPRAVVATGLAGALSPALRPGALILPHEIRSPQDPDGPGLFPAAKLLATARAAVGGSRISTSTGVLLTVDRPIRRPVEKSALAASSGATAVDMESAAILRVAKEANIPALVLRGISDGARDSLPEFGSQDPASVRGQLGIASQALRSPRKMRNLLSIARGTRRAFSAMRFAHAALVPALARTLQDGY